MHAFVADPVVSDRRRGPGKPCAASAPAEAGAQASPVGAHDTAGTRRAWAVRRYRHPVPIRVAIDNDRLRRVTADRPGVSSGRVEACAGPWRTSGDWWTGGWNREEWEVALDDGSVCRIFQDRDTGGWFMDAVID
jgi:hypothetical protein